MWTKTMHQNRPPSCRTFRDHSVENEFAIGIPANIQKNENEIIIHLALAGYDKSEVSIKLENQDSIVRICYYIVFVNVLLMPRMLLHPYSIHIT